MTGDDDYPLVTFAVIAYSQESVVRAAVEGALAQTYQPLEIILSDDCSPDGTFAVMEKVAAAYEGPHRVVLNRNPRNLGLVPHLDRVMAMALGEFFVVNAGDDVSRPERVERQAMAWLSSSRSLRLVHSATQEIDAEGFSLGSIRRPPERVIRTPSGATFIRDRGFVIGATAAWDREVYDAFGPLGEGLSAEDRVIPFRAALLGDIAYIDEPLVNHRSDGVSGHSGQLTGRDYLYGISHKLRKWTAEIDRHILTRYADIAYPDKAEIEAVCRERERRMQFPVDLASVGYVQRLAMLPRALRLAWQDRSVQPVKQWVWYMFDRLYMPYATWITKHRRAQSAEVPHLSGRE